MADGATESRFRQGTVVAGKYELTHVLGKGGMGYVVAATHLQLERRVAIKFLLPEHLDKADVVGRFTREARAAAKIQNDHVAHVLDVGVADGAPFMVMEYLEGEDLKDVLKRRGPLPVEEAVRHMMHACEALAEAHELGIVHRDLKPANLFIAKRANGKTILKVLDFGISKLINPTETELTLTTGAVGSPSYMSPEQLTSSSAVDCRADVWGLGVVLYELLTRRRPFFGDSMPTIVAKILKGSFDKLDCVRPNLPLPIVHAVHRCLELEPEDRFATVTDLAIALAPFAPAESASSLEGLPRSPMRSVAPGEESVPGLNQTGVAGSMSSPVLPMAAQESRRGRPVPVVAFAAMAVLGGAYGVWAAGHHPAKLPATTAAAKAPDLSVSSEPPLAPPVQSSASAETPEARDTPAPSGSPDTPPGAPPPSARRSTPLATPRPATRAASATSAPATTSSAPACHVVSYFDAFGDKHFKEECR